jgi:hypothetical protein
MHRMCRKIEKEKKKEKLIETLFLLVKARTVKTIMLSEETTNSGV